MPRSKTWWYTRITVLVLGLIAIFLSVPILYSLADAEMDGSGGLVQVGLMVLWIIGFVFYLGANYRGSEEEDT